MSASATQTSKSTLLKARRYGRLEVDWGVTMCIRHGSETREAMQRQGGNQCKGSLHVFNYRKLSETLWKCNVFHNILLFFQLSSIVCQRRWSTYDLSISRERASKLSWMPPINNYSMQRVDGIDCRCSSSHIHVKRKKVRYALALSNCESHSTSEHEVRSPKDCKFVLICGHVLRVRSGWPKPPGSLHDRPQGDACGKGLKEGRCSTSAEQLTLPEGLQYVATLPTDNLSATTTQCASVKLMKLNISFSCLGSRWIPTWQNRFSVLISTRRERQMLRDVTSRWRQSRSLHISTFASESSGPHRFSFFCSILALLNFPL